MARVPSGLGRDRRTFRGCQVPVPGSGSCPAQWWCVWRWRGSGGGTRERRGGLACDFDALCDFDRRIHTSKSHKASISHVVWLAAAGRAWPAGTGVANAVTVSCGAGRACLAGNRHHNEICARPGSRTLMRAMFRHPPDLAICPSLGSRSQLIPRLIRASGNQPTREVADRGFACEAPTHSGQKGRESAAAA